MDTTAKCIEIYEQYLFDLRKLQSEGYSSREIDEDILRVETHIRRLKTNHAECIEPCCLGCPATAVPGTL